MRPGGVSFPSPMRSRCSRGALLALLALAPASAWADAPGPGAGAAGAGVAGAGVAGTGAPAAAAPGSAIAGESTARPGARIDLVFVFDSTGSMGGVLAVAKAEMARIISELRAADPSPDLRLGVMTYRDKGDVYRERHLELTRDLDAAYSYLLGVEAGGGADWPEDVNHALMVAVSGMNWDWDRNTARVVFLVGDAPPHMDYAGDPTWHEAARIARARGIVINTIATNEDKEVEEHFRGIAAATAGAFDRIDARTGTPVLRKATGSVGAGVGSGGRSGLREGLTRDDLGPEGAADSAGADAKGAPAKGKFGDLVIEGTKKAAAAAGKKGAGPAPGAGTRKGRPIRH